MEERRLHERREARIPARIFADSANPEVDSPIFFGQSLNVSTGGALIETPSSRFIEKGNRFKVCLMNSKNEDVISPAMLSWTAEVVRKETDSVGRIAVKFLDYPRVVSI